MRTEPRERLGPQPCSKAVPPLCLGQSSASYVSVLILVGDSQSRAFIFKGFFFPPDRMGNVNISLHREKWGRVGREYRGQGRKPL